MPIYICMLEICGRSLCVIRVHSVVKVYWDAKEQLPHRCTWQRKHSLLTWNKDATESQYLEPICSCLYRCSMVASPQISRL